jgi:outer membrane lipoprotein-sorting protein
MKLLRRIPVGLLLFVSMALPLGAQSGTPKLAELLASMDTASKQFKTATANFQWDYYEKIVHDTTTQSGSIYFKRDGGQIDMAAVITGVDPLKPKAKPGTLKVLQFQGGRLQMFDPGLDQVQVFQAGANQAEYEQFLTLGFGGSGSDLQRVWNITDLGPDTLSDDGKPVKTEKLDLVSKDAANRKSISHVTIWVDPQRAISLKQIFYQTSGNYRTATYTNIKLNGPIDTGKFAIKKDKNTTTISH